MATLCKRRRAQPPTGPMRPRGSAGFTLIEVLGAIFLTSLVLAVAVGMYLNLSNSSTTAVAMMREGLHATAVLDRIARDLSGASLLTRAKSDIDPLRHPWYFTAESHNAFGGADALKFVSRSQRPKVSAYHASDLAQVAYFTTLEEDGSTTLHRWTAPSLPPDYEPGFPGPDDPGSFVLAEGLRGVVFRFRGEDGEWLDEWDSKQLIQSDKLPTAVEVSVFGWGNGAVEDLPEEEWPAYVRQVVLRQRPIDLAKMIQERVQAVEAALAAGGASDGTDDEVELDEDGNPIVSEDEPQGEMTLGDCVRRNMDACVQLFGTNECTVLAGIDELPISQYGGVIPGEWGCR